MVLKQKIKICGLDCSSTVCGYNIIEIDTTTKTYTLLKYGYKKFTEGAEPIDKSLQFKNEFLPEFSDADLFVLEDFMKTYNKTHPITLAKLTHINASVEVILTVLYGKERMEKLNVNTARKLALGKSRVSGVSGKDYAFQQITKLFEGSLQMELKPRAKTPIDEMYDITDSIVLSLAQAKKMKLI